jgi:hypothetical protein
MLTFTDASDAAQKLLAISRGYADQRNDIMRQELLFDVPMIGLGIAAIANPLFNGAKNATLGLSLGAAAAGGARLYFGPQTKIAAYNTAAQSLLCARSAASQVNGVQSKRVTGQTLVASLNGDINLALPLVSTNPTLAAARDQAVKSVGALQTAIANLDQAPGDFQDYAVGVIGATDSKITGSVQNVSSVISAVQTAAAAGAQKTAAPAPGAVPPPGPIRPPSAAPRAPTAAQLQSESAQADAITSDINGALGKLAKCPTS